MPPRVLVVERIHKDALKELRSFAEVDVKLNLSREELLQLIPAYDALVVRSGTKVTRELLKAGKRLRVVARAGVGLDNVDLEAAEELGVEVMSSPEASTISVAELVFGGLIALCRNVIPAHLSVKQGKWEREKFLGTELFGKRIGIVGFGRIGREVAMRANAFGMEVYAYDPNITEEDAREYNAKYVPKLEELLRKCDVVTLHVPLTNATRRMIGKREVEVMKDGAILVNTSRGEVVDEDALYEALRSKKLRGAVLDVYSKEPPVGSKLLELENVVLTPHLGASTEEAQRTAGIVVAEKLRMFFEGRWKRS